MKLSKRLLLTGLLATAGLPLGVLALTATPAAAASFSQTYTVTVPAGVVLTDSGVTVLGDQTATITATGSADVCGGGCPSGPNGATNGDLGSNVPGAAAGLLYYNQNNQEFTPQNTEVGTGPVSVSTPGELYFGMNDGSYYGDNSGSYQVTVVVTTNLASTALCKNGGWKTWGVFKNQGDCVSFVATNGSNLPG